MKYKPPTIIEDIPMDEDREPLKDDAVLRKQILDRVRELISQQAIDDVFKERFGACWPPKGP